MSKKFLTSIDLAKNQLIGARIENLAAAPSSPGVGQFYFDTTLGYERVWDGTVWERASFATDPHDRTTHTGTQLAVTISNFDAQVRSSTLNQMAAPTAALPLNGQKLTGGSAASADSDIPTYRQLLDIAQNKSFKDPVRVIATANLALTGTQTIDGVAVVAGDRVLAAGQTTSADRGIYVVAAGAWTRAVDFDVSADAIPGTIVPVTEGTANADTQWQLTTNGPIVLGTTALTFTQFGAGNGEIGVAGAGLTKTGTTYNVGQGTGILVGADDVAIDTAVVVRKFAASFGDGSALFYVITHNLNTKDVTVGVYDNTTPFADVECDVEHTSTTTVTLRFAVAPTANQYRCVVQG